MWQWKDRRAGDPERVWDADSYQMMRYLRLALLRNSSSVLLALPRCSIPLHPGAGGPKGAISPFFHPPSMPVTSTFLGIRASGGSSLSVSCQIKAFRGQCYHWGYKTVPSSWNLPSGREGGLFHGLSCSLQEVGEQDCFLGRWVSISCKSFYNLQILLHPLWGGLLMYIPFPLRITPAAERCHWWEQDTSVSG